MIIIAFFVVLVSTVSSRSDSVYHASMGFEAPNLTLVNSSDSSVTELGSFLGRYVIVNFWAASDAPSRIAAHDYDRLAATMPAERLSLIQVNLDRSKRLVREIVRRDNLNATNQFTPAADDAAGVEEVFNLEAGLQSYLIDPSGKIVAVNPDPALVESLVRS